MTERTTYRDDDLDPAAELEPAAEYETLAATDVDLETAQDEDLETAEIRADIEATREEMSGTLGAIGEKLDPGRIVNQAKDTVREATIGKVEDAVATAGETARGAGTTMLDTIKQNPIPAAMAGIGLVWLWRSRASQGSQGQWSGQYARGYGLTGYGGAGYGTAGGYATGYDTTAGWTAGEQGDGGHSPVQAAGQVAGQARDTAGQVVGQAGQTVGQVAGQAGQTVGQVAGQARQTAGQVAGQVATRVQGTASQVVTQTQTLVQQTSGQFQRIMQENPLALGAVATGVGVAVGLLVPETPGEHKLLGEARDTVAQRAGERLSETMDKVSQVAEKAQETAKEEAQAQGLKPS